MKTILKSILFILVLFMLVQLTTYFLMPKHSLKKYGLYNTAAYDILEEPKDTIDVIALGDSLIYTSISPLQIWGEYGFTVYDCATPAQIIQDSYKYLKVAIDSQHPKIVMMEANVLFRDWRRYKWYDRAINEIEKYIPINKYHDNWKTYLFKDDTDVVNSSKGYKKVTKIKGAKNYNYMENNKKTTKFPEGNLEYFAKIVKLCEDNNVKLIIISTPSQGCYNYERKKVITNLAKKYNLEYLDLNENNVADIDWTKETKDKGDHINYYGAQKVSAFIGKFLQEKDMLTDHRKDNDYKSWNDAYKIYINN